jgi:hypothetical protein
MGTAAVVERLIARAFVANHFALPIPGKQFLRSLGEHSPNFPLLALDSWDGHRVVSHLLRTDTGL